MSMSSHLLERGARLWKSGQQAQAHKIFETIIYNDRRNEAAWLWFIYTLSTNPEKIAALENFLTIFPGHPTGTKALLRLKQEEKQRVSLKAAVPTVQKKRESIPQVRGVTRRESPSAAARKPGFLPWLLVVLGLCILFFSAGTFATRYNALESRYESVIANRDLISRNFEQLSKDYETLKSENSGLTNEYNSLVGRYNSLSNEYVALQGNYENLSAEHASLKTTYDSLLTDYNYTVQSYSAFQQVAISPPYIYTRERKVHLVFKKLDGSLLRWTIDSDWLEYHLRRGDELRKHLNYDLSLYNEFTDETYSVVDDRDFIDATPFTNLMADLYAASPNDYAFLNEVWNIVAQLTAYTSEIQETPRFPMETLLSGGGDCEDHAILFASMILAAPTSWEVKFIYMDGEHPNQPQTMNHVIVQVVTSGGPYLVEATSKVSMNPYTDGVYGWSYSINGSDQ